MLSVFTGERGHMKTGPVITINLFGVWKHIHESIQFKIGLISLHNEWPPCLTMVEEFNIEGISLGSLHLWTFSSELRYTRGRKRQGCSTWQMEKKCCWISKVTCSTEDRNQNTPSFYELRRLLIQSAWARVPLLHFQWEGRAWQMNRLMSLCSTAADGIQGC